MHVRYLGTGSWESALVITGVEVVEGYRTSFSAHSGFVSCRSFELAADFGVRSMMLTKWLRRAAVDDRERPGTPHAESEEACELRRRNRLLEQEVKVFRPRPRTYPQALQLLLVDVSYARNGHRPMDPQPCRHHCRPRPNRVHP